VVFGSALGIGFSGSAVLRVKFTGERKPEVRRAVKMVALLLVRIPGQTDHLFRTNPIRRSGVFDHFSRQGGVAAT